MMRTGGWASNAALADSYTGLSWIASGLGVMPWDVLHQGLSERTGLSPASRQQRAQPPISVVRRSVLK